jgi:hypothetical protein
MFRAVVSTIVRAPERRRLPDLRIVPVEPAAQSKTKAGHEMRHEARSRFIVRADY